MSDSEDARAPLSDATNSPRSRSPSPVFLTARSRQGQPQQQSFNIRRKVSVRTFRRRSQDSSESAPSPHPSLYDAPGYHDASGDWLSGTSTSRQLQMVSSLLAENFASDQSGEDGDPVVDAEDGASPSSPPLKVPDAGAGSGTTSPPVVRTTTEPLETIIEQKSHLTLRPKSSLLSKINSMIPTAASGKSVSTDTLFGRKQSFSLPYLPLHSHQHDCSSSSTESGPALNPDLLCPQPQDYPTRPIRPPPFRVPTPPGLPHWPPPRPNRSQPRPFTARNLLDLLRLRGSTATAARLHSSTHGYGGTQSGYGSFVSQGLEDHPFHHADVASSARDSNGEALYAPRLVGLPDDDDDDDSPVSGLGRNLPDRDPTSQRPHIGIRVSSVRGSAVPIRRLPHPAAAPAIGPTSRVPGSALASPSASASTTTPAPPPPPALLPPARTITLSEARAIPRVANPTTSRDPPSTSTANPNANPTPTPNAGPHASTNTAARAKRTCPHRPPAVLLSTPDGLRTLGGSGGECVRCRASRCWVGWKSACCCGRGIMGESDDEDEEEEVIEEVVVEDGGGQVGGGNGGRNGGGGGGSGVQGA
ncbi:MAG: hypothetical protein M1819_005536 [Sarea resinae]|nr:MAG: hypothetical protein M1819_005536 [Sarea resinae]